MTLRYLLPFLLATLTFASPMRNEEVIQLVKRGVPAAEIIERMNDVDSGFRLYDEDLRELRKNRVPDVVIDAMMQRQLGRKVAIRGESVAVVTPAPEVVAVVARPEAPAVTVTPAQPQPVRTSSGRTFAGRDYGFQRGTVAGSFGAGSAYQHSIYGSVDAHAFAGQASVGLTRYVGVYGLGGYAWANNVGLIYARFSQPLVTAGAEVVGTNRSRVVPYGRVGFAYIHPTFQLLGLIDSHNIPGIAFGGGARVYVTRHLGFQGGFLSMRFLGEHGGFTSTAPIVGWFFQSR